MRVFTSTFVRVHLKVIGFIIDLTSLSFIVGPASSEYQKKVTILVFVIRKVKKTWQPYEEVDIVGSFCYGIPEEQYEEAGALWQIDYVLTVGPLTSVTVFQFKHSFVNLIKLSKLYKQVWVNNNGSNT